MHEVDAYWVIHLVVNYKLLSAETKWL